jgi:signal transduction histidine kinase
MMRPVRILSEHLGVARETLAVPIPEAVVSATGGEFGRLFRGYNALVRSMKEREEMGKRLAEEKRLGSLGRLASAVAHEINNPLGGLFNALSTLKSHGHLRRFATSARLAGARRSASAMSSARHDDLSHGCVVRDLLPADIDDLGLLIGPEARRKSVEIVISNLDVTFAAQHADPSGRANLILNAVAAAPEGSQVSVSAEIVGEQLKITVTDRDRVCPQWRQRFYRSLRCSSSA